MNANTFSDAANVISDVQQHTPADFSNFVSGLYHGANGIASLLRDGPTQFGSQEINQASVELMNSHLTNNDIYDGGKLLTDLIT